MQSLALVALLPYFLGVLAAAPPPPPAGPPPPAPPPPPTASAGKILTNPNQLTTSTYDYIVVGGGTAGNVVANRLSAGGQYTVLVLEAGQDQTNNVNAQIPLLCTSLAPDTPLDWNYTTTAQPGLNGRAIPYARGFALGGSSAINYLVYNRGSRDDWDNYGRIAGDPLTLSWAAVNDVLRFENEDWTYPRTSRNLAGEYNSSEHSSIGNLQVSLPVLSVSLDAPVINTAHELAEFPYQEDMNGGNPIGVGWTQSTVNNGVRADSNSAYIQGILTRPNLQVLTGARATRVLKTGTQNGTPVFRGVEFATSASAPRHTVTARQEVVLAGGSFNSPQLLMLSGIGPKAQLASVGIPSIVDLPSVGQNMSDHVLLANTFQVHANDTLQQWTDPSVYPAELAQWKKDGSGVLGDPGFRQLAWLRIPSNDSIFDTTPDPTAGPTSAHYELIFGHGLFPGQPGDPSLQYINILTNVISTTSRGSITLASSNPFTAPIINPNLLGTDFDKYVMNYALRAAQRFASSKSMSGYVVDPAAAYGGATSDADLTEYAASYSGTVWHPVGTTSVSPRNAPWGVLNSDLTVKKTIGLSVVDASGIPKVPTAHTQGVVYLWAERAALEIIARRFIPTS